MIPPLTLTEIQVLAASRGGRCLADAYVNARARLAWECSRGHVWETSAELIRRGRWCPVCRDRTSPFRHTLEAMQELASSRGGACLSDVYKDARSLLRWRCAKGHEWEAAPTSLLSRKSWCPHCAGCARLDLTVFQAKAQALGGQCTSLTYRNTRTHLGFTCAQGHTWTSRPDHILDGHWCPYCQDLSGEAACREWLEGHFQRPFSKAWPLWLRPSKRRKLQLDGYNEELGLAFEYQGAQHYRHTPWFHRTPMAFTAQLTRDAEKRRLCEAHGVYLIVIPYDKRPVGAFIAKQLDVDEGIRARFASGHRSESFRMVQGGK
jgi:hypothetical protein